LNDAGIAEVCPRWCSAHETLGCAAWRPRQDSNLEQRPSESRGSPSARGHGTPRRTRAGVDGVQFDCTESREAYGASEASSAQRSAPPRTWLRRPVLLH